MTILYQSHSGREKAKGPSPLSVVRSGRPPAPTLRSMSRPISATSFRRKVLPKITCLNRRGPSASSMSSATA